MVRGCPGQHVLDVVEGLGGGDVVAACSVEGGDGGGAALGLDAVQQDGASLLAQVLEEGHGVVQDEAEVRVLLLPSFVDQPDLHLLDAAGRDVANTGAAQRHHGIHPGWQAA